MSDVHIAPRVAPQGSRKVGSHIQAWRNQPKFDPQATITLLTGSNIWSEGCPGYRFYQAVFGGSVKATTVQQALDLGAKAGFKAAAVQGHLRWLYTAPGQVEIGGKQFSPPPAAPKAPRKAPSKAKAS